LRPRFAARSTQHYVARNLVSVVDELLREFPALGVVQFKVQILHAAQQHRAQQAQRGSRRNQNIAPLRRTLLVADDLYVLVQQLAAVEKFVVVHDPVSKVMNFFKDTRCLRVVEVELAGRKKALALDSIPVALDKGRQRSDKRPALLRLHGATEVNDGFHIVTW